MNKQPKFIILFTALPLAAALMLSSCGKPASTPEPGDDSTAMPIQVQYVKIDDVNPGAVQEVKVAIPQELDAPDVAVWQDGSSLAMGSQVEYKTSGKVKKVSSAKIVATKFDAQGNTAWTKTYTDLGDGYVQNVRTLPGGGFVFIYNAAANAGEDTSTEGIVFCGTDGSVLKAYSYGQPGILGNLYVTETGDIFTVGGGAFSNGAPASTANTGDENSDACIMKFSSGGALLYAKKFGGANYDCATGAVWAKDMGLVVSVSTQSSDGDIKLPNGVKAGSAPMSLLVCFDGNGQEKWQYFEQGRMSYNKLLATAAGVAVSGYKDGKPFLMKLGADGVKLWNADFGESGSFSIPCMAALPDGSIAAVIARFAEGSDISNELIATLGADGKVTRKAEQVHENIIDLLPMADGGLVTVGVQNIKTVPQPPEINSIWYDTETIASRLDGSLNVQWRKVYDQHKDVNVRDIAVPLSGGAVLIEK